MSHTVLELSEGTSGSPLEIMKELSKIALELQLNWFTNCEMVSYLISMWGYIKASTAPKIL